MLCGDRIGCRGKAGEARRVRHGLLRSVGARKVVARHGDAGEAVAAHGWERQGKLRQSN